jgi:hypothetical protein
MSSPNAIKGARSWGTLTPSSRIQHSHHGSVHCPSKVNVNRALLLPADTVRTVVSAGQALIA